MKRRFVVLFALLAIDTVLVLAFTVQFLTYLPVRTQVNLWLGRTPPAVQDNPGPAQVRAQAFWGIPARSTPTPVSGDRADGLALPDRAPQSVEPAEIVYRVVEKQPPDGSLVIPALDLEKPLVPVAVRGQEWDISTLGTDIGWLETTGSRPGDGLAMVLIGHITLPYPGGYGPFLRLHKLKTGDVIEYRTEEAAYIYTVKSQTVVDPQAVASLYREDGSTLLLVTCSEYNALEHKFYRRLIVEAELERVESLRPTVSDRAN